MISGQEFLTGCNEFWGVKGVSNLRWSNLLAFWRSEALLSWTGLESFRKQARTGCSCVWFHSRDCIFPLQDEHLLYPCDCLTFSDWSGKQKWTQPVRRRSVCCTIPADKKAVQPRQISEMVWKAFKLNKGSCIIDFLHGSINKTSYLVTHLFNLLQLFGQPTTTQFWCPNPIAEEEIKIEWFQSWSISQVNIPLETHKVVNRNFFAKDLSSQEIDWLTSL